ncbi:MAG: DUF6364 family protein [Bacteroidia bacterium]
MKTKLTLTIDDSIIESAKQYAKDEKKSISALVESYLEFVTRSYRKKPDGLAKEPDVEYETSAIPKDFQELYGIISLPEDFDYKEFIREERYKDYMYGRDRKGVD